MPDQIIREHSKFYRTKSTNSSRDHLLVNSATIVSSIVSCDDANLKKILHHDINIQQLKQIFRYAIINSKLDLVKLCIEKKAPINSALQFRKKFVLPLDIAQISTNSDIIQFLIDQGAYTAEGQKENRSAANIVETEHKDLELTGEGAEFQI